MKKSIEQVIYEKFGSYMDMQNGLSGFRLSVHHSFGETPEFLAIHAVDGRGMVLGEFELSDDERADLESITQYQFSSDEIMAYQENLLFDGMGSTTKAGSDLTSNNDKLLRVMQSLNDSFPDEHYADIEKAAESVLAALEGDA